MRSAKYGPNLWQIWQVFGPWASICEANGQMTIWQCYTNLAVARPTARTVTTIPLEPAGLRGKRDTLRVFDWNSKSAISVEKGCFCPEYVKLLYIFFKLGYGCNFGRECVHVWLCGSQTKLRHVKSTCLIDVMDSVSIPGRIDLRIDNSVCCNPQDLQTPTLKFKARASLPSQISEIFQRFFHKLLVELNMLVNTTVQMWWWSPSVWFSQSK